MVFRVYVEKRQEYALEAERLKQDLVQFLGIRQVKQVRMFNRYDAENMTETQFARSIHTVFSEPQTDIATDELPEECLRKGWFILAVEYLPGQFDQRADSAAQCIQLQFQNDRPIIRNSRIYCINGTFSAEDLQAIRAFLINPVESREATLGRYETLVMHYPQPGPVPVLDGFIDIPDARLGATIQEYALAMDEDDLAFCRTYFKSEGRNPSLTELRVIDTYWSDHCRHTTFMTEITDVVFDHSAAQATYEEYLALRKQLAVTKPVTLMHLATVAAKYLKSTGALDNLDISDEINACTVKTTITVNGRPEPWLLLFKNETHNHPTEIEPFGGAATCIGGAIRDPLSGRAYVYQAMRVTGAGDPRLPPGDTIKGKLPQRKIVTEAAAGYSSYGNQIGLATGLVDELYHPGYVAKRMEIGAVVGAVPAQNVRRETPQKGDVVVLLGGRTGRDGCGGATGSSKTHNFSSLDECAAEVQKGNAPEERKLQRLFRNPSAARLIKRCNDFGAGGVCVAIGELADGLMIDLDKVPKKYEGLSGTELAISESQERMAVVLSPEDVDALLRLAGEENLEATPIAFVTDKRRLQMRFHGNTIVDISREFLNTNGARKRTQARVAAPRTAKYPFSVGSISERLHALISDLNVCCKRGLVERFDSTIGAGTVLMPLGGKYQATPAQCMAAKLPAPGTDHCSVMAYGFNPHISEADPYAGAYLSVIESVAKLAAAGTPLNECYLTFQEYFPRLRTDPSRWGLPLAALLGALKAQLGLKLAAIGGKDSMSGSFEALDVPPTLVSFAVALCRYQDLHSPEFKHANSRIALLKPALDENGLPTAKSLMEIWAQTQNLLHTGRAYAAWTPTAGGIMEGIFKMCLGNRIGAAITAPADDVFAYAYGSMLLETNADETAGITLGHTSAGYRLTLEGKEFSITELESTYKKSLADVYPSALHAEFQASVSERPYYSLPAKIRPRITTAKPRVLIPVFPGTNCEYDSQIAWEKAGAAAEIFVVRNRSEVEIMESARNFEQALSKSEILFLPGGFSGGDEPDGSAKFITAFLRNQNISDQIMRLLEVRGGLIGGICNGFQALVKLGLLPYGKIQDMSPECPTLTFNTIGRHQSRMVRIRAASNLSPWLMHMDAKEVYLAPVSHGEGRFVCPPALLAKLHESGQVATQYVDMDGRPSMHIDFNPNGSVDAIEGITSPDGRIFGKMGHTERIGEGLYKNIPGNKDMPVFESAVEYFS